MTEDRGPLGLVLSFPVEEGGIWMPEKVKVKVDHWTCHVQFLVTPWAVDYHGPPSVGLLRQEYWSGLPFPSPERLKNIYFFSLVSL